MQYETNPENHVIAELQEMIAGASGVVEEIMTECETDMYNDEPGELEGCWIVPSSKMILLAEKLGMNVSELLS